MTDDQSFDVGQPFTHDKLRGFRLKADADWADSWLGINQVNVTFSQGIKGLGSTSSGDPSAPLPPLPTPRPMRAASTSARSRQRSAGCSRCCRTSRLFVAAYGQYAFTPLLVSEQCSLRRALLRPRLRSLADARRPLLGRAGRTALRHPDAVEAAHARCRPTRTRITARSTTSQPAPGTPRLADGTSVGGGVRAAWEDTYTADISVAKAVEGPRDDWRAFVILGAKY